MNHDSPIPSAFAQQTNSKSWLATALLALLAGCGSAPQKMHSALHPGLVTSEPVQVTSIIAQDEVYRKIKESEIHKSGGGGGLIGLLFVAIESEIDKSINNSRRADAERELAPLLERVSHVDFRADFWDALKVNLDDSPWLKVARLETGNDPRMVLVPEATTSHLLTLETGYYFQKNMTLTVYTRARYYLPGGRRPVHEATYTYLSVKGKANSKEQAVATWAAQDAAAYKAALHEGIAQTMAMLRSDFLDPKHGNEAGKEVASSNGTRILRYSSGLISVASTDNVGESR